MDRQISSAASQSPFRQPSIRLSRNTTSSPMLASPLLRASSSASPQVWRALSSSYRPNSVAECDLSMRFYKEEEGQLVRLSVDEQRLAKTLSSDFDSNWSIVLDPTVGAGAREDELAAMLELTTDGKLHQQAAAHPKYFGTLCLDPALPPLDASLEPQPEAGEDVTVRKVGEPGSIDYRVYLQASGADVSPWHGLPLSAGGDKTFNFVCEIPQDTTAKMEVATREEGTPIKQDVKKGKLRFYPYPIDWNYGMLPQTWEDPEQSSADTELAGLKGDDDPVDVVEIGGVPLQTGGVYPVKALGAYAMLDEGELDWKLLCIRKDHPLAPSMHGLADIERFMPGELERIMIWFRDYKIPDGKPANSFAYGGKPIDAEETFHVIADTHSAYIRLRDGERPNDGHLAMP